MVIKSSRSPGSKFMLKVFIALLVALGVAAFLFVSAARAEDGRVPSCIGLIDETYKIPELEAQGHGRPPGQDWPSAPVPEAGVGEVLHLRGAGDNLHPTSARLDPRYPRGAPVPGVLPMRSPQST